MSQLDFFQGYLNQGMGNLMNGTSSEMACAKPWTTLLWTEDSEQKLYSSPSTYAINVFPKNIA